MGFIKVKSTTTLPFTEDNMVERVKLKSLDSAKILKASEIQILPFAYHQTRIETATFIPIQNLVTSIAQEIQYFLQGYALGSRLDHQGPKF